MFVSIFFKFSDEMQMNTACLCVYAHFQQTVNHFDFDLFDYMNTTFISYAKVETFESNEIGLECVYTICTNSLRFLHSTNEY